MTIERRETEVGGIRVEVVRKDINNLHVAVYPPNGRVRVAAPLRLDDEAIRLAIVSRLAWIRRQQATFLKQERQSERELANGESHYFWGRRHRLCVVEKPGPWKVRKMNSSTIEMTVRPDTDRDAREAILMKWYRRQLRELLPTLRRKWEHSIGVEIGELRIKKMKTKWGSCNREARRIWLNLELVKKPVRCVEYVLVHEMVHLLHRHHNEDFRNLMDSHLPNWRHLRDELNRTPLAHEDWSY